MANTLNQVGIETGNIVEAYHITQSIDAFTGTIDYDIYLSGSFNMTGSINGEPGIINPLTASYAITTSYAETASYAISASYEINYETSSSYAETASIAESSSYALSASYAESSSYALSASYAESSSYALTASYFDGSLPGSISSSYAATASTINVASINTGTTYYPVFVLGTIPNNQPYIDKTSFAYNAVTDTLTVTSSRAISSSYALTASYVNLVAGPNITINQVGTSFQISGSSTSPSSVNIVNLTTQLYTIPGPGNYMIIQNHTTTANCSITMPSTANLGDVIEILEIGTSRTTLDINGTPGAGQRIQFASYVTTTGAAGSVETRSTLSDDNTYLKLICTNSGSAANTGQRWVIVEVTSDNFIDGINSLSQIITLN